MKIKPATGMAIRLMLACMILAVTACNLFDNEETVDELGWKKRSMPDNLPGIWYKNDVEYIHIGTKKVILDNREWILMSIFEKDDEVRLIAQSGIQHRAFYCRNLHETSVEISFGYLAFSAYDAKVTDRIEWVELKKQ